MKKFMSILLSVCMLLSCLSVAVFAEDAAKTVVLSNCDSTEGWSAPNGGTVDAEVKTEGEASISSGVWASGDIAFPTLMFTYGTETPVDITGMKYLIFDLYVSSAAKIQGMAFRIDLPTKAQGWDSDSRNYENSFTDLKDGWNTIVLDVERDLPVKGGSFDPAKLVGMRFFANQPVTGVENFVMKLDNIRFSTAKPVAEPTEDPMEGHIFKVTDTLINNMQIGAQNLGNAALISDAKLDTPLDITGYESLCFDIEVVNAAAIQDMKLNIELTSGGTCDVEEWQVQTTLAELVGADLQDGVNHASLDLKGAKGSALNMSAFNYVRMFSLPYELKGAAGLKISNVYFSDGYDPNQVVEEHVFRVNEESEQEFLEFTNAGFNGNQRFSDASFETIYKYTIKNVYNVKKITWTAKVGAQLLLQVSTDKEDWKTVFEWKDDEAVAGKPDASMPTDIYTYDFTEFLVSDGVAAKTFYVRIADSYPDNGWGGSIFVNADATLAVTYVPLSADELDAIEAKSDGHSILLNGCNISFAGFNVDNEDAQSGSGCWTTSVGTGFVKGAKFDAIDGTGFDTLEFEMYVSDPALFDRFAAGGMNSGFEITSSGACDKSEIAWNLAAIRDNNQGGEIVAGWNHIILPLSTANATPGDTGDFDISAINFIRIFMVGEKEDTGITLKLDNIRLTDREAQLRAEAVESAKPTVDQIKALGELTVDSFNASNKDDLEKAITKARKAYDKLSDLEKSVVESDVYSMLTKAEKALKDYEKKVAEEEAQKKAEEEAQKKAEEEAQKKAEEEAQKKAEEEARKAEQAKKTRTIVIIVVAAVVVVAAAVCVYLFVFKKKKA